MWSPFPSTKSKLRFSDPDHFFPSVISTTLQLSSFNVHLLHPDNMAWNKKKAQIENQVLYPMKTFANVLRKSVLPLRLLVDSFN